MAAFSALTPQGEGSRATPLAGCLLTDSEIDHTTGLLLMREGCQFPIFSTAVVRDWLREWYPLGRILAHFADRPWHLLEPGRWLELPRAPGADAGLRVRPFETDRHVPRFVEDSSADATGSVIGLELVDAASGGKLIYAPCVASIGPALAEAVEDADAILVDGTFWSDEEPQGLGIGDRSAREMGHLPVDGDDGSLAWLSGLKAETRIYVHINNTNPMLRDDSAEHAEVIKQGVRVGRDGDEIEL